MVGQPGRHSRSLATRLHRRKTSPTTDGRGDARHTFRRPSSPFHSPLLHSALLLRKAGCRFHSRSRCTRPSSALLALPPRSCRLTSGGQPSRADLPSRTAPPPPRLPADRSLYFYCVIFEQAKTPTRRHQQGESPGNAPLFIPTPAVPLLRLDGSVRHSACLCSGTCVRAG